jgi:hypothetical protein
MYPRSPHLHKSIMALFVAAFCSLRLSNPICELAARELVNRHGAGAVAPCRQTVHDDCQVRLRPVAARPRAEGTTSLDREVKREPVNVEHPN